MKDREIATGDALLDGTAYASYAYAYPHKTAYRALTPPVPLRKVWSDAARQSLFLYVHIPFCEMRCGFCNLFTTPNPPESMESVYLDALERQATQVQEALGPARIARMALGGGTPTFLSEAGLIRVLDLAAHRFHADMPRIPVSVETSPRTAEPAKLRILRDRGIDRISIGIQSFIETEVAAIGRAQRRRVVDTALEAIRDAAFPTLNIDLMYGLPGQTRESWQASLQAAVVEWRAEEIYLYPLYVRPLTGLGRASRAAWDDQRQALYRYACDFLTAEGYVQVSMRMFRSPHAPPETTADGPVYCCQEDDMVGLGCGARSYTRALHYASEYAVGRAGVRGIIDDYIGRSDADFAVADYGATLTPDDQRRRYVLYTLLTVDGIDLCAYRLRFGTDPIDDLPELSALSPRGLAELSATHLRLTAAGLERSDAIGPWLYSDAVRAQMETFHLR